MLHLRFLKLSSDVISSLSFKDIKNIHDYAILSVCTFVTIPSLTIINPALPDRT